MTDIYTGLLYFGVVMAVATAVIRAISAQGTDWVVMALAAYLILAAYLGFYAALDVLRREPEPYGGLRRAGEIVSVMLAFTASGIIGGLIAWRAWQKALRVVGMEEWQKSRLAAQTKAAMEEWQKSKAAAQAKSALGDVPN